jgi:hypothetical protein
MKVTSKEAHWREIGLTAKLVLDDDLETDEDVIDAETGNWRAFVELLEDDSAWQVVAKAPCKSIAVLDDEID